MSAPALDLDDLVATPPPPRAPHVCEGPFGVDSAALAYSGCVVVRVFCPHGRSSWRRVEGDVLIEFVPPRWTPGEEFERGTRGPCSVNGTEEEYLPTRRPIVDEAHCWFCKAARHPPCALHGGLPPRERDRINAAENHRARRDARRAGLPAPTRPKLAPKPLVVTPRTPRKPRQRGEVPFVFRRAWVGR